MKDYHINVFWSDDDDCYVADIPDLEFCSAMGSTPEEAVAELQIARKLWIEAKRAAGQDVPEPRYRPAIYQTL
jgi:predicted RNase H-like HicB family nuclease